MYHEKKTPTLRRQICTGVLTAAAIVLLLAGAWLAEGKIDRDVTQQSAAALKSTVLNAAVQCYAIEGAYPQSLSYLEENYGLQINRSKFYVGYDAYASNQLPEIQILVKP